MSNTQNPITQNEVSDAAEALQVAKAKVTILAVREKLGRGSFTTVKKFLDHWQSSKSAPLQQAPPVPPQLESLWIEARRVAEANLAVERESLSALALQLDTRLEEMEVATIEAQNANRLLEVRLNDKSGELERTQATLEDLRRQRDNMQSKLESSEATLSGERASWTSHLREISEQFAKLNESQIDLLSQGTALADALQVSTTALAREVADFTVSESKCRVLSTEKLSAHMASLLQPVSAISARLTEVERQMRKLNRRQLPKNFRGRSR